MARLSGTSGDRKRCSSYQKVPRIHSIIARRKPSETSRSVPLTHVISLTRCPLVELLLDQWLPHHTLMLCRTATPARWFVGPGAKPNVWMKQILKLSSQKQNSKRHFGIRYYRHLFFCWLSVSLTHPTGHFHCGINILLPLSLIWQNRHCPFCDFLCFHTPDPCSKKSSGTGSVILLILVLYKLEWVNRVEIVAFCIIILVYLKYVGSVMSSKLFETGVSSHVTWNFSAVHLECALLFHSSAATVANQPPSYDNLLVVGHVSPRDVATLHLI